MKGILFLLLLFAWLLVPTKNIYPDLLSVVDVARQESRGRFKFYFSDLLLPSEAKQFTRDVREAQKKVEAYWGNTFSLPIPHQNEWSPEIWVGSRGRAWSRELGAGGFAQLPDASDATPCEEIAAALSLYQRQLRLAKGFHLAHRFEIPVKVGH